MVARTDPDRRRLDALHACAILETPAEDTFDQLARLAAHLCGAAVAAIGFVGKDCEWFKSSAGMELGTLQNLAGAHVLCRLALGGRLVQVRMHRPIRYCAAIPWYRGHRACAWRPACRSAPPMA